MSDVNSDDDNSGIMVELVDFKVVTADTELFDATSTSVVEIRGLVNIEFEAVTADTELLDIISTSVVENRELNIKDMVEVLRVS